MTGNGYSYKELRERQEQRKADFYENMKRDLMHCCETIDLIKGTPFDNNFPSGEMAEMSFMQGGFPDDDLI